MNADLIYDVGSHNGSDTAHYLSLGFRVVAVDANPLMISRLKKTFGNEIDSGQLIALNCAIDEKPGQRTFWVSDQSEWSSLDEGLAKRFGTAARATTIESMNFNDILLQYGTPFYLKIDIEGADEHCLNALANLDSRPKYVSWEAAGHHARSTDQLRAVYDLGYTKFKLIRQTNFLPLQTNIFIRKLRALGRRLGLLPTFAFGSSGPFGENTYGRWQPWTRVAEDWRHYREMHDFSATPTNEWFDFHASR